ncbi:MAG: methyltransferase domain-containing protein [Anaerolineaceae bacterium]|nr:methyltransferase domain-containing protein [Anaerolineaceae bacterium]
MTKIFALTTRGLESISAAEIAELEGVSITETSYRRIAAECSGPLAPLLTLRTVDDIYLDLDHWDGVFHTRDMLAQFNAWSDHLDVQQAAAEIRNVRPIPEKLIFSISVSFIGKRNYTADEVKLAVADSITFTHGWTYTPDDREANLNIRVFIEHEEAYIGVRLGSHAQHERLYKMVERPGALKPTVAAAMLRLVDVQAGQRLLDPCCGSGTILIEAALMGASVQGGDNDPDAVKATLQNMKDAEVQGQVEQWDARVLPLRDGSNKRIVTNLPWGRQTFVNEELGSFYTQVCGEMERIIAAEGRIAILTSTPHLLHFNYLQLIQSLEISLFGQNPTISIYGTTR